VHDGLETILDRLVIGARAHAARNAAARAELAAATARSVAAAAEPWVRVAATIKELPSSAGLAEEISTGPLATLRLLLMTARSLADIGRDGVPRLVAPPRLAHPGRDGPAGGGAEATRVEVEVLPAAALHDGTIFQGHRATVRCVNPGGLEAFARSRSREAAERPRAGGVAVVLGAGNVTGLAPADAICQIFEHGRAVLLKLHPLHAPLGPVYEAAFQPLVAAGLLAVVAGGAEFARTALRSPQVTHVHLTGGRAAFDAIVWGGPAPRAAGSAPLLATPITCELGNVTPWIVVPGRYTPLQLRSQADMIAASIANNTSFNCIATKLVLTCRSWGQRDDFLRLVTGRLESLPPRRAWSPGAAAAWEALVERRPPADGTLPWVFRAALDPATEPRWLDREWFVPVAAELPLDADGVDDFCGRAMAVTHRLPGSLAANVTVPESLAPHERQRVETLLDHLGYGVVAVNCWSALAYALGNVPWGGFPGATLDDPRSGIGFVHDPLLLPLVHNSIVRGPLATRLKPPWFPWHTRGDRLARGVVGLYEDVARGRSGLWRVAAMLPDVLRG
jgi:acyl-CoA reductase-like NAD-dependent aldehyde dehydrogenase